VGTPLHFGGLSTQRRGSMDARQEASEVWVCLVGSRRNPATDWGPIAALTLTVRDERFTRDDEVNQAPRLTLKR
jgi:hypothetical protein